MHSALILAGGSSTRLGRPKALIEIAGRPIVARVADILASLVEETIVSVADAASENALRAALPDVRFVRDARSQRGPIEGFRGGFRAARGEFVLLAPCDAPLLRSDLYRLLLDVVGTADAAVPRLDVFDPVRAVYRRSAVFEALEDPLEIKSPSALVDRLRCVFVDADRIRAVDPELSSFLDVNTAEDLEAVLDAIRLRGG